MKEKTIDSCLSSNDFMSPLESLNDVDEAEGPGEC